MVALDSQGAITRVSQLGYTCARSWIEEEPQEMAGKNTRQLMWVKGHRGIPKGK